jgi:hypothetical protein
MVKAHLFVEILPTKKNNDFIESRRTQVGNLRNGRQECCFVEMIFLLTFKQ